MRRAGMNRLGALMVAFGMTIFAILLFLFVFAHPTERIIVYQQSTTHMVTNNTIYVPIASKTIGDCIVLNNDSRVYCYRNEAK